MEQRRARSTIGCAGRMGEETDGEGDDQVTCRRPAHLRRWEFLDPTRLGLGRSLACLVWDAVRGASRIVETRGRFSWR